MEEPRKVRDRQRMTTRGERHLAQRQKMLSDLSEQIAQLRAKAQAYAIKAKQSVEDAARTSREAMAKAEALQIRVRKLRGEAGGGGAGA